MATVGSLAYSIIADTSQLTGGVTASRSEIRALKAAFEESRTPVQRYSAQIEALERLQQKFPASAGSLQRAIDQTRAKMTEVERPTSLFRTALSRLPIVVDPVSAAFQAFRMATDLARQGLQLLMDVARRVGDQMQKLDDLSKRADLLGVTETALVGLAGAAQELSGVDMADFERGMLSFSRRLAQAAMEGTGAAHQALERLGLSAQELSGMSLDQALLRVADAMQGVSNPSERLQLAFQLLGDNGRKLATMLAAGSDEIQRLADGANRLNQTEFIDFDAILEANDSLQRVGQTVEGLLNVMASEFAPVVEDVADSLTNGFANANKEAGALTDTIRGLALVTQGLVDTTQAAGGSASQSGGGLGFLTSIPGVAGIKQAADFASFLGIVGEQKRLADQAEKLNALPIEGKDSKSQLEITAAELERIAKVNEEIHQLELDAERSVAAEQAKRDAARLKALEEQAKAVERLRDTTIKGMAAEAKALTERLATPSEKLREELDKMLELRDMLTEDEFVRGLEDLRGKAEGLSGEAAFTGPRTVGAIQAGSIEALRAQFEPRSIEEKMLKTEEKSLEEAKKASSLLTEISGRLAAAVVKEAP